MCSRRRGRLVATLVLAALLAPAALAEPPGPPGGHGRRGPGHFVEKYAAQLDLDPETRAVIESIVTSSRSEGEKLDEELRAAHRRMRELLSADEPDEEAVMAQVDAIGALEVESHKSRLRAMLAIRALLTPEQRSELVQIREERRRERFAPVQAACPGELESLCGGDEGWSAVHCLRGHADELSPACRDALPAPRHGRPRP